MAEDNYFLPHDYQVNNEGENVTIDEDARYDVERSYWSPQRIKLSLSYQAPIYNYISKLVEKNTLVLDIGCGIGSKLVEIIGQSSDSLIGLDQPSAVEVASKKYPEAKFIAADFDDPGTWNLSECCPSVIICSDVIEHLANPENLLSFIQHLATDNTRIFISTPDREKVRGIANRRPPNKAHIREWSAKEFKKFVEYSGFKVVNLSYHLPYDIKKHGLINTLRDYFRIMKVTGGSMRYNMLFELSTINENNQN
tara:strand:- start:1120 stop:1878 length:759 start_codon:yes stop_codon:yes gene_type:complete